MKIPLYTYDEHGTKYVWYAGPYSDDKEDLEMMARAIQDARIAKCRIMQALCKQGKLLYRDMKGYCSTSFETARIPSFKKNPLRDRNKCPKGHPYNRIPGEYPVCKICQRESRQRYRDKHRKYRA